jgi:hypothetical protein
MGGLHYSFFGSAVRVDRGRQYPISNKEYPISKAGVAFAPDNRAGRVLLLGHWIFLVGCWVLSKLVTSASAPLFGTVTLFWARRGQPLGVRMDLLGEAFVLLRQKPEEPRKN